MNPLNQIVTRSEIQDYCASMNRKGIACELMSNGSEQQEFIYVENGQDTKTILATLFRCYLRNVLLVGDAGVGKTTLVRHLARDYGQFLKTEKLTTRELQFVSLNVSGIIAGTKYRGELEEKVVTLFETLKTVQNVVLFIDEAHTMTYTASEWGVGLMDTIKQYTHQDCALRFIIATTFEGAELFQSDSAFMRRFETIEVSAPSDEQKLEILSRQKLFLRRYHGISENLEIDTDLQQPLHAAINDLDLKMALKALTK